MIERARILVVAATSRELARPDGWGTLLCGVGPVEAAAATAAEIGRQRPSVILHVGIAGARRSRALPPTALVIGSESRYCDLAAPAEWAHNTVVTDSGLIAITQRAFPAALLMPIGTSANVGGSAGCDVEGMEGFGVLRAAQIAGVPALEVRAISNDIEETDRSRWHFDSAFAAITAATPILVRRIADESNEPDA